MKTYWYEVNNSGYRYEIEGPKDWKGRITYTYDLEQEIDCDMLVRDCAEDYHLNKDGWEDSWPLKISIAATEDGPIIATYDVEREAEPVFYASKCRPA